MSLRTQLQFSFLLIGLLAIGLTGWEASELSAAALTQATEGRLLAIRESRKRQIERHLDDVLGNLGALAADVSTREALGAFSAGFARLPTRLPAPQAQQLAEFYESQIHSRFPPESPSLFVPPPGRAAVLQYRYLVENPERIETKGDWQGPPAADSPYAAAHQGFHPVFRRFNLSFGLYDLLLAQAATGVIVYSVIKESDLGRSLREPPLSRTRPAEVFAEALTAPAGATPVLTDFARYPFSFDAPAAFAGAPVFEAGRPAGVLLAQISLDEINRVMTGGGDWSGEGLGRTGETYIVGPDFTLRSHLRPEIEQPARYFESLPEAGVSPGVAARIRRTGTSVLAREIRTEAVRQALAGRSGLIHQQGYAGKRVVSAYAPLRIQGLNWVLVAEISESEAYGPVSALARRIWMLGFGISAVFLFVGAIFARTLTRPLKTLVGWAARLGQGEFRAPLEVRRGGEIGQLAQAFAQMAQELERTTVSKVYLDELLESMLNAVLVVEAEPPDAGLIRSVNRAACNLLDSPAEELAGKPIDEVAPGLDRRQWIGRILRKVALPASEIQFVDRSGRRIPVLFTAALISERDANRPRAIVCVAQDITNRKEAEQALTESREALRTLTQKLIAAGEDERSHIARELHDDISQRMAALAIQAGRLEKEQPEPSQARAGLHRLKADIGRLAGDVHGLSRRLHPSILDDLGLETAVQAEVDNFASREGIDAQAFSSGDLTGLPRDVALCLYRIVQEGLRNVSQHAKARRVAIHLEARNAHVQLRLEDDGQGFDPKAGASRPGLGLASMEERVRYLNGTFHLDASPGTGTRLRVTLPVNREES